MSEDFDSKAYEAMRNADLARRAAKRNKPETVLREPGQSHTIETKKYTVIPDAGVSADGYVDSIVHSRPRRPDTILGRRGDKTDD